MSFYALSGKVNSRVIDWFHPVGLKYNLFMLTTSVDVLPNIMNIALNMCNIFSS